MRKRYPWELVGGVGLGVFFLDQLTKAMLPVVALNSGSSWGVTFFSPTVMMGLHWLLTLLLMGVLRYSRTSSWASGLVLGGAFGNGWDRVWYGGVRDWFWVPGLAVHNNLADWALTLGVGYILLELSLPYVISYFVPRFQLPRDREA